jgi:prefoldin subunit 5
MKNKLANLALVSALIFGTVLSLPSVAQTIRTESVNIRATTTAIIVGYQEGGIELLIPAGSQVTVILVASKDNVVVFYQVVYQGIVYHANPSQIRY